MTTGVVVEGNAEQELEEAIRFYDDRKPGLGQRFRRELRQFLHRVAQNPQRYRPVGRLTRRANLANWPYSVFFTIRDQPRQIIVVSVYHHKRDPEMLRQRIK